jgi:AhpD family alkylhydroperoxidase
MSILNHRDRELVALGAALASNCVPCIEFHIVESRSAGLSDAEITAAVELANQIKGVPARKVLDAAFNAITGTNSETTAAGGCSLGAAGDARACC